MSIPHDLADLIKINPEITYDQAVVHQLRRLVNGDPWEVITQIAVINNSVNQDRLFDLLSPDMDIESVEVTTGSGFCIDAGNICPSTDSGN